MRVLLSTIGTRGEVQPVLAVALQLKALGQEVRIVAPPDFRGLLEGYGLDFVPVGPELRNAGAAQAKGVRPSAEAIRKMITGTVTDQFAAIGTAAEGCDVLVGCGEMQFAARSIAEFRGVPYFFAVYCPATLPSEHHAPLQVGQPPAPEGADNRARWELLARHRTELFGEVLNTHRAELGLDPVGDVLSHAFTDRPLLAADPVLAPWPAPSDLDVVQTGAWLVADERPLPDELEAFLAAGEPPIYFGFGSRHASADTGQEVLKAARALGRRAIVLRGWADLSLDAEPDCLSIGEVNQQALFSRVAAVVHHGGAGTTTTATLSGSPQVVVPHHYDQPYFAQRVEALGIGVAHAVTAAPTADSLIEALGRALQLEARAVEVRTDGALVAAKHVSG